MKTTWKGRAMQLFDQSNVVTRCSDDCREGEAVDPQTRVPRAGEKLQRGRGLPAIGVGGDECVVRDDIRLGNFVEQLVCEMGQWLFSVGVDHDVEGEDIGGEGGAEGAAGGGEAAAFGVEESEVVGDVGVVWD